MKPYVTIAPTEGHRLRHPETGEIIPPEGAAVPAQSPYVVRALAVGAAVEPDAEATESVPKKPDPVSQKKTSA